MSGIKASLFSQVLSLINRNVFARIIATHDTDKCSMGIASWTHLVSMVFMQLAGATSLRDISNGLRSATGNLNHLGVTNGPTCEKTHELLDISFLDKLCCFYCTLCHCC